MKKKILCLVLSSLFISLHAGYAQNKPLRKSSGGSLRFQHRSGSPGLPRTPRSMRSTGWTLN